MPLVPATPESLDRAASLLRKGGVVAFPTETVYGLGASAFDVRAVARIFDIKRRPEFDPLIVHVLDEAMLATVVSEVSPTARILIDRFWPGPLTLILRKHAGDSVAGHRRARDRGGSDAGASGRPGAPRANRPSAGGSQRKPVRVPQPDPGRARRSPPRRTGGRDRQRRPGGTRRRVDHSLARAAARTAETRSHFHRGDRGRHRPGLASTRRRLSAARAGPPSATLRAAHADPARRLLDRAAAKTARGRPGSDSSPRRRATGRRASSRRTRACARQPRRCSRCCTNSTCSRSSGSTSNPFRRKASAWQSWTACAERAPDSPPASKHF